MTSDQACVQKPEGSEMFTGSFTSVAALAVVTGTVASVASAITIPTVRIGNPGNAPNPSTGNVFGSVAYTYRIATTEVTNAQYAHFLNSVAVRDPNVLYNTDMAGSFGGIIRSGFSGSFSYTTIGGRENNPVNFVSFWDAARFVNWLHNGQPSGPQSASTTEDGAYTLTPGGIANNTVTRNTGWQWALPSPNEWYKAAHYQPTQMGGPPSSYWQYATSSNTISPAQANYNNVIGNTTPVGAYAANYYGLFDMAGNVWEWTDAIDGVPYRNLWGGSYANTASQLRGRVLGQPQSEFSSYGFRVVQIPSPWSITLLMISVLVTPRRR